MLEVISGISEVMRAAILKAERRGIRRRYRQSESLEVAMLKGLLRRYAFLWIKSHHFVHQIDCLLTCVRYQLTERGWHEFRESEADFRSELVAFGPLGLCWATQDCTRLVDLICFIVAWEQGSHKIELRHNCSKGKDVDRTVIVSASKKNLWCSVPARADIVRERWPRSNFSRQAEVSNFDGVALD